MVTLTGTPFRDELVGGPENDTLAGLGGDDLLVGTGGGDRLDGGTGFADQLLGGGGDDLLIDPDGASSIRGGDGRDTIAIAFAADWRDEAGGSDGPEVAGDRGDDSISVILDNAGLSVEIVADVRSDGGASGGNDTVSVAGTYAAVIGDLGGGDDIFFGGGFRDDADGGSGRDWLDGAGGADNLAGGADDDFLSGGGAGDDLSGGAGFLDTLLGGTDDDVLSDDDGVGMAAAGRGNDTIDLIFSSQWDDDDFAGTFPVIDGISGDLGSDSIVIHGGPGGGIVILGDGAAPSGLDGADTIEIATDAFYASATILAGGGRDRVLVHGGSAGADLFVQGDWTTASEDDGDDTIEIAPDAFYANATILAGGGHDDVTGSYGQDLIRGGTGFDVIIGRQGSDTLDGEGDADFLVGGVGADLVIGQAGGDTLWGDQFLGFEPGSGKTPELPGDGADTLLGGPGNDVIVAGAGGGDLLYGGAGDDFLYAGVGSTTMAGGNGFDTYYVGRGDGPVTIIEDDADGAGNGLALYWGNGPGPFTRLSAANLRYEPNPDGTWTVFFSDGSGAATFHPGAIPILNIFDVGPDLQPLTQDDIQHVYRWNGTEYA